MDLFWKETYGFLSQLKNSVSSGEIYLLQCDDEIQKEEYFTVDKITEEMPETVKVKGFGCTSFVPVFERADKLISEGKTISSLIYLTDGMGICVKEKRDYPVYFVLPGENGDVGESLPEWIECVYLDNN
jgi:predicted metal-dependent peptidase